MITTGNTHKPDQHIIVAADIGYGYTKATSIIDGETLTVAFPSAYAQVARQLHDGSKRKRIHTWDNDWYFGKDALIYSKSPITSRDRNRPQEMIEILFLGLLSELGIYHGEIELHTALPVEWLGDADTLRGLLTGRHIGQRLDQNDKRIDVTVGRPLGNERERSGVFFYPQPLASFLSRAAHDDTLWEDWSTVLIVDVGTGTFNECLIVAGEWIDERATSKPHGLGVVLEAALQDQEAQTGRRDLLHIARGKLWARNRELLDLAQPHIDALAEDVIQAAADIAENISLQMVILTGGGAHFIQSHVRARFGDIVSVSQYPELDNVKGLLDAATE